MGQSGVPLKTGRSDTSPLQADRAGPTDSIGAEQVSEKLRLANRDSS